MQVGLNALAFAPINQQYDAGYNDWSRSTDMRLLWLPLEVSGKCAVSHIGIGSDGDRVAAHQRKRSAVCHAGRARRACSWQRNAVGQCERGTLGRRQWFGFDAARDLSGDRSWGE